MKAHRDFMAYDVTDDMALAERAGLRIARVAGEESLTALTDCYGRGAMAFRRCY